MKNWIVTLACFILGLGAVSAQVSETDYNALRDLYEKTGGADWTNKSGWDFSLGAADVKAYNKNDGTGWYGVTGISKGRVEKIELIDNNLHGAIPESVYTLTMIRTLNLSKNHLTGTISPSIGNLPMIQILDLSENNLEGAIPVEILDMGKSARTRAPSAERSNGSDLRIILHKNQLTGEIPANIGEMALLHKPARTIVLNFNGNKLTGEIPASILKIEGLTAFLAAYNQLTGSVPEGLAQMPKLTSLRLEKNKLTGEVPQIK